MKIARIFTAFAVAAGLLVAAPSALAYNPSLSASANGSNVVLNISNAYPNSSIQLSYTVMGSSLPTTVSNFGYTDSNGYYSTTVSSGAYGITGGSQLYVTVGGQQSNTVTVGGYGGCGLYGCGTGGLSLSQTSVSLNVGQTSYVTASSGVYNPSFYISSNSNSSAVSASVSGSQISLYGISYGSSTVTVCSSNGGACGTVYVTVGGGYGGSLSLSQNNISLSAGQTSYVTANGYGGSLYVSNNSNSSVVSASVSGSQISLYGLSQGSATVTVCSGSFSSQCASVYVTVSGSGNSGSPSLSQTSVNLSYNQSTTVTAYNNYGGNLYVSQNSNPSAVSVSVSGNSIYLSGLSSGSSSVTVCSGYSGNCGTIYVYVSGNGGSGSSLSFSQSNLNLTVGQSASVSVYNNYSNYSLYLATNSYPSVASVSMSGNTLNIYGLSQGNTTITVCTNGSSQCGSIYVSVSYSGSSSSIILSPSSLNMSAGQNATVSITSPYSSSYYISSNSNPSVASASIQGGLLTVYASNLGFTSMSICQSSASQCAVLSVNVNNAGGSGSVRFLTTTLPSLVGGQYYNASLQAAGGNPPYTFTVTSGNLPSGLSLSTSGQLTGVPAYGSSGSFWVMVRDNFGQSATMNYYLTAGSGSSGGGVLGLSAYNNGALISENGTVYIVYKNTKAAFASAPVFRGFGFSFGNVINSGLTGLADSGHIIRTSASSHPWGSWIKSGSTVYFVHEFGLIPVPDYSTFLNNGGQDSLVVAANRYDFGLPQLSPMVMNDSRLR